MIKRTGTHESRLKRLEPAIQEFITTLNTAMATLSSEDLDTIEQSANALTNRNCVWYMKDAQPFILEAVREARVHQHRRAVQV